MKFAIIGLILSLSSTVFAGAGLEGTWLRSNDSYISNLKIEKFDGTYIVRGAVNYGNLGWFNFRGTTEFYGGTYRMDNGKMTVAYGRVDCYYKIQLILNMDGDQLLVQANVPDRLLNMENYQCPRNPYSGFDIVGDAPFKRK